MSLSVIEDLDGSLQGTRSSEGIEGLTRSFLVSGLADVSLPRRVAAALLHSGVPRRGEAHPGSNTHIVDTVDAALVAGNPDLARVTVEYTPIRSFVPEKPVTPNGQVVSSAIMSTGTSVTTVETQVDLDGNPLEITYVYQDQQTQQSKTYKQIVNARIQVPVPTISFSRDEAISLTALQAKVATFVGTVNKTGVFGDAPRTWMCTGIQAETSAETNDVYKLPLGVPVYRVRYDLQRATPNETWDSTRLFIITSAGVPKDQVNQQTGNGVLTGRHFYPESEFRDMKLSL